MENKIVSDFERLRVFSSSIGKMDDLVHDLSMALEDAASHKRSKSDGGHGASSSSTRRHPRKRKGRRRRYPPDNGTVRTISEASQSSLDEAIKDYMENCVHSDSDDLALAQHIVRLTMPLSGNYVPTQVESDSVNESMFSPVRPQRRRKRYKSMAIDPDPSSSQHDSPIQIKPKYHKQKTRPHSVLPRCSMGTSPIDMGGFPQQGKESSVEDTIPGKRKRSTRQKTDCATSFNDRQDDSGQDDDNVSMAAYSQENSSISSSVSSSRESLSGDEYSITHEADDEQSDFFHESGASSGIPGTIPWWENERVNSGDESMVTDTQFEQILNGSFQHLSKSSQIAFKARVTKIMKHCGRDIRFGRRKLKGTIPKYTVQHFIEERHNWNHIQSNKPWGWQLYGNNNNSANGSGSNSNTGILTDSKRQRKTPPPVDGVVFEALSDPIPESNIGNRMLQSMGWAPGSGLGTDGSGIKIPVTATLRPRRSGLGHDSPRQKNILHQTKNTASVSSHTNQKGEIFQPKSLAQQSGNVTFSVKSINPEHMLFSRPGAHKHVTSQSGDMPFSTKLMTSPTGSMTSSTKTDTSHSSMNYEIMQDSPTKTEVERNVETKQL